MNIIEYCLLGVENRDAIIMFDEANNCYLSSGFVGSNEILCNLLNSDYGADWVLVAADKYSELAEYEIIVDEDVKGFDSNTRRPYYRMRGKKVTEEQAFDIIRRVDRFFSFEVEAVSSSVDYIGSINFYSWIFDSSHYGWVHVDGTIGCNGTTGKYPDINEFISEWFANMIAFPYLDLVIAITNWDELPPYAWESISISSNPYKNEVFPDFLENIDCGIWVHDKVLEIMRPKRTVEKYVEYVRRYENRNKDMYLSDYYNDNGIVQADVGYLKKCIEAYGLNADEELGKVRHGFC